MTVLIATLVVFLIAVTAMSAGVILSNKCLTRGCGGALPNNSDQDNPSPCDFCDKKGSC